MHVSIVTREFATVEMIATDVCMMPSSVSLWNAELDEGHFRKTNYDVFREFCDSIIYKKPRPENVATSNDYYLSVPRELIDSIFIHETRCECGLKEVNNDASMPELQGRN